MKPDLIHRNVWAASATSFLTDVSSEMVTNVLPLFLSGVLGVRTSTIGLIEGVAESVASLVKVYSGSLSDRLRRRKPLAVAGYALSALAKPFFYVATTWGAIAGVRWVERVGKGVRTAPRDALIADSTSERHRGLAFGLHRGADTAGAVVGLLIALAVIQWGAGAVQLDREIFQRLVLFSLIPAFLGVGVLLWVARDVTPKATGESKAGVPFSRLGRPFLVFLLIAALFDLGNFSDAFLILRAEERGLTLAGILWTLLGFNLTYAIVSTPVGALSDRVSRRSILSAGWLLYAVIYLGFARAQSLNQVVILYLGYGAYYGVATGTAKAFIADLVDPEVRGRAYGLYHAALGVIDLPASLIAGILWQGMGDWQGLGASAPFYFGAAVAALAALLLMLLRPGKSPQPG